MITVIANIRLNNTRETPVFSLYRPAFFFETEEVKSGSIRLINTEIFEPGTEQIVFVDFIESKFTKIKGGEKFEVQEGSNVIGQGKIISVL